MEQGELFSCSEWSVRTFIVLYPCTVMEQRDPLSCHTHVQWIGVRTFIVLYPCTVMEQRDPLLCHTLVQWMKRENIYRVIPLWSKWSVRTFTVSYPCKLMEQREPLLRHTKKINILFYDLFRNESERVIFLLYFFSTINDYKK